MRNYLVLVLVIWMGSGCGGNPEPVQQVIGMDTFKVHCMDAPKVRAYSSDYYPDTFFELHSAEVSRKDPNIKDGHYIIYYDKAFTHKVYAFDVKNGWKDGHYVYWYRNGQKRFEGYKDNRVDTGFYTKWNREGEQQLRRYYKNDSISRTIYEYYPSGALKLEAVSKGYERIEERTFYENGNRQSETFYERGEYGSYREALSVFMDSLGNYSNARKYDYKVVKVPGYPGEWRDSVIATLIEELKKE